MICLRGRERNTQNQRFPGAEWRFGSAGRGVAGKAWQRDQGEVRFAAHGDQTQLYDAAKGAEST